MAIIYSYPTIITPSLDDTIVVTDVSSVGLPTKTMSLDQFSTLITSSATPTGLENLNAPYDVQTATWRLIGRDKAYYLTPGVAVLDFSYNDDQVEGVFGLTGGSSTAFGGYHNSDADGSYLYGYYQTVKKGSFAYGAYITGNSNTLNDYHYEMTVGGYFNTVSTVGNNGAGGIMYYGAVIGAYNSMPSGRASFMFGAGLIGESAYTTIVGAANVDLTARRASSYSAFDTNRNNPAFIVGVGDVNIGAGGVENPTFVRRNGFVVIRTGDANFPELSTTMIDAAIPRSAVTKEWVESKIPASPVLSVKVSLTASQIKSLGTIPVDVIAASGVGTYIKVTGLEFKQNYGTAPFANLTTIYLRSSSKTAANPMIGNFADVFTGTVSNIFGSFGPDDLAEYVENEKVVIQSDADSATGDSTIDLYISYQIITL